MHNVETRNTSHMKDVYISILGHVSYVSHTSILENGEKGKKERKEERKKEHQAHINPKIPEDDHARI